MSSNRPEFRKAKAATSYATAEELFNKLPNRSKSHGYLRQPQADVLRQYQGLTRDSDIALELPTGTGKTLVGLLIAEWRRRRSGEPVAFLTVTNQLARQVIREGERIGIRCANLIGTKETRDPAQVGLYKTGQAVAVTTYSNLFNIKPVIQASNVIVFDDAHGGEQVASDMWTVRIEAKRSPSVYEECLDAIRMALTETQLRTVTDRSTYNSVELADTRLHPGCTEHLTAVLDGTSEDWIRFPWIGIRNHLEACLIMVSAREICIRPLVPPSHVHTPFAETKQRIYMSATLGGEGDLQRGYGIHKVVSVRAEHAQWGKRYIFMPELHMDEHEAWRSVGSAWSALSPKRALLLAPSGPALDAAFEKMSSIASPAPRRLGKQDVEDSLDPFVESDNSALCLAGRYDGIDLPGDDCRLLVMYDSPSAVNSLERHLRAHWKLGPVLRRRERTRLIQGLGRCTRDATDYAVIFMLGQSLVDSLTMPSMRRLFPAEIQREILWGMEQGGHSTENEDALANMAAGLLQDNDYRGDANESISDVEIPDEDQDPLSTDEFGSLETQFSRAMWSGNFTEALEFATKAADASSGDDLIGYRAWWLYLASKAASLSGSRGAEADSLQRARSTGINAGYLDNLLRTCGSAVVSSGDEQNDVETEAVWQCIDEWGWRGPAFGKRLEHMRDLLAKVEDSTSFHRGLELLGKTIGAGVLRPTEEGAPDVVWIFHDVCYTFEAKASARLSKKYVLQAKGHPDWVRQKHANLSERRFQALAVSPKAGIDEVARPHAAHLNHVEMSALIDFAQQVSTELRRIRTKYLGKDYGEGRHQFKMSLRLARIDRTAVDSLLSKPILTG